MRPALFLHTQKTAGSSIQDMARLAYGDGNVVAHEEFLALGQAGCARFPFLSGHFGFEFARPLMPGRYCFTFLRDPIERLLSFYAWCRQWRGDDGPVYQAARTLSLDRFLEQAGDPPRPGEPLGATLWNHQVWQLAFGWHAAPERQAALHDFTPRRLLALAKRNLACFDHVGFVETFDRDAVAIFRALGAAAPATLRSNVGPARPRLAELPAATQALLHARTRLDRRLYAHAWSRYRAPAAPAPAH